MGFSAMCASPHSQFDSSACASGFHMVSTTTMSGLQMSLFIRRIGLLALSCVVLSVSACTHPAIQRVGSTELVPSPDRSLPSDRRNLAGEWEYEDGAVFVLTLDEQGNGPYAWKDGRIETQMLTDQTWKGMWFQKENDREGGFSVEFSPDFSEGDGTWWYTRIGDDQTPSQKGGTFHLTRKSLSAKVSETPPAP